MVSAPPKPQFFRFLEAAQERGRSHLQRVFTAKFLAVVRARDRSGEPFRLPSSNGQRPEEVLPAYEMTAHAADACGREITFACDRCGSPSVVLPEVFDDVCEVRCGACGKWLMTWKDFKTICEKRARSAES